MILIKDAIAKGVSQLSAVGNSFAQLDTEALLSKVLTRERIFLITHPEYPLSRSQEAAFSRFISRRKHHEPLAYILGRQDFCGLAFTVRKGVLIPRPETETLVELALEFLSRDRQKQYRIADVGCGSGCVGIALLSKKRNLHITAFDTSPAALRLARLNRHNLGISSRRLRIQKSDLLTNSSKKFDIIIANLPYLSPAIYKHSRDHAELRFEPRSALVASQDGLQLIFSLIKQSPSHLHRSGRIFLEIGHNHGERIRNFVAKLYPRMRVIIKKDLCNRDRFAILYFQTE